MAEPDLRVRLLGRALGAASITGRSDEQIVRMQQRSIGHHPVVDLLLGGLAPGVDTEEDTAAGAAGRMPHGFLAFPRVCRSAPQALEELCAELRLHLAAAPAGSPDG